MIVKFENRIDIKINEYIEKTGTTKIWIAKQMGFSKQNLYAFMKSENPNIVPLIKLSLIINCEIKDLYDFTIIKEQ